MGDIEQDPRDPQRDTSGDSFLLRVISRIDEVEAAAWDACAGPDNPFITHAFLKALEDSGSATAETGWLPQHLLLEDSGGTLIGCMPCYLKSHSQGEYVFDHGWADAYMRAGGRYYPKLQASIPFTPVTGKRLLVRPGVEQTRARGAAVTGGGSGRRPARRIVAAHHLPHARRMAARRRARLPPAHRPAVPLAE